MIDYNYINVKSNEFEDFHHNEDIDKIKCNIYHIPEGSEQIQIKVIDGEVTLFNMEVFDKDIDKVERLFKKEAVMLFKTLAVDELNIVGFFNARDFEYYVVDVGRFRKNWSDFDFYDDDIINKLFFTMMIKNHLALDLSVSLTEIIKRKDLHRIIIKPSPSIKKDNERLIFWKE